MKIMPISTQQNQQQDFQGRVSQKTIKRINKYAKIIINSEIEAANYLERGINKQLIKDTVETRDNLIKNLTSFAKLLHPDSVVSLNKSYGDAFEFCGYNLSVKNRKIHTKERLEKIWVDSQSSSFERTSSTFKSLQKFLKKFDFSVENAKQVDTDMFSVLFNRFSYTEDTLFPKPKRIAKKIDKFAEEFGYPKDCLKMLEHGISNATYPGCLKNLEPKVKKVLQEERTSGILSSKPNEPVSLEKYLKILKLQYQRNKTKNTEIVESFKKDKIL